MREPGRLRSRGNGKLADPAPALSHRRVEEFERRRVPWGDILWLGFWVLLGWIVWLAVSAP